MDTNSKYSDDFATESISLGMGFPNPCPDFRLDCSICFGNYFNMENSGKIKIPGMV